MKSVANQVQEKTEQCSEQEPLVTHIDVVSAATPDTHIKAGS